MPGRSQVIPMKRLLRIMAALKSEDSPAGVTASRLCKVAGYEGKEPADELSHDLRRLRLLGIQIDQVAKPGKPGRYRLSGGDTRLRLKLAHEQWAALQRAAILTKHEELTKALGIRSGKLPVAIASAVVPDGETEFLSLAVQALQTKSRLRFNYAGESRDVSPAAVRFQDYQWYLVAAEVGQDVTKTFALQRMSEAVLDQPDTAVEVGPVPPRLVLHPLKWEIDPPTEVTLLVSKELVADVERWLKKPKRNRPAANGFRQLTYVVTNRASFRARIYVLGMRVRVLGPDEFRQELLADLKRLLP